MEKPSFACGGALRHNLPIVFSPQKTRLSFTKYESKRHILQAGVSLMSIPNSKVSQIHTVQLPFTQLLWKERKKFKESHFQHLIHSRREKNSARQEKLKYLFQWVRHRQTYVRLSSLSQLCSVKVISGLLFLWFTQSEEIICPSFCTVP